MQPCQPSHVPEKGCLYKAPEHHKGLACTGLPAQGTKTTHMPCLNRVACTRHQNNTHHIQCKIWKLQNGAAWKLHFEASKKLHFGASKLYRKNMFKNKAASFWNAASSAGSGSSASGSAAPSFRSKLLLHLSLPSRPRRRRLAPQRPGCPAENDCYLFE